MQVYGPSVSDQSSESSGTALFTRYLSCKLHANCTQIACPGMIVTLLPILPCADSHTVQISTLCRFLPCVDSPPCAMPIFLHNLTCMQILQQSHIVALCILSNREKFTCQHFEQDRVVNRPRQCVLVSFIHIHSAVCNMSVCSSSVSPRASVVNPRASIVQPRASTVNPKASSHQ